MVQIYPRIRQCGAARAAEVFRSCSKSPNIWDSPTFPVNTARVCHQIALIVHTCQLHAVRRAFQPAAFNDCLISEAKRPQLWNTRLNDYRNVPLHNSIWLEVTANYRLSSLMVSTFCTPNSPMFAALNIITCMVKFSIWHAQVLNKQWWIRPEWTCAKKAGYPWVGFSR